MGPRAPVERDLSETPPEPGSTLRLGRTRPAELEVVGRADARSDKRSATAYELLQSLNLGARERVARKQKVAESRLESYASSAPQPSTLAKESFEEGALADEVDAPGSSPARAADEIAMARDARLAPDEEQLADLDAEAPALGAPKGEADAVARVVLDPMIGRAAGPDEILLYRTVLVGEQGYRQGMLLDRTALATWLSQRVIAGQGLTGLAEVGFPAPDEAEPGTPGSGIQAFLHRFAEPFDALSLRLALEPLPGVGSRLSIYALAGLVLVAASLGLFAVYRMVTVVVHYAERRSNFVAAVSHELKTPLAAIRMYGEMLRDDLVPSESKRREYYRTITDESERLSRLINNVLEFSRLEKGTRSMHLVAGPIGGVLEEAAERLRPHARREGFELVLDVDADLPPLRFDRDALLQVLFNLVDNAMKYARDAQRREIRIEARCQGGGAVLAVRDFGPGVSARQAARVFEPFYRGEHELTRTTKGTGIGLALVKELAERMGAAVSAANVAGGGFRVQLALEPGSASHGAAPAV
jgi:signal transduction histidine kinase